MRGTTSAVWLFVAAAAIFMSQCSRPTAPSPPVAPLPSVTSASAIGRVLSGPSRAPAAGVTLRWISVTDSRQIGSTSATTDGEGLYALWLPIADRYSVTVDGVDGSNNVLIGSVQQPIDFFINMGSCPMVYGTVLDGATKRPVAGATVGWRQGVTTDANGQFQISHPCGVNYGTGTTSFSITHPGYQFYFTPYWRAESMGRFVSSSRDDRVIMPAQ